MTTALWPEAANRRLRALMWKGWSAGEAGVLLGRTPAEAQAQARRLGITRR